MGRKSRERREKAAVRSVKAGGSGEITFLGEKRRVVSSLGLKGKKDFYIAYSRGKQPIGGCIEMKNKEDMINTVIKWLESMADDYLSVYEKYAIMKQYSQYSTDNEYASPIGLINGYIYYGTGDQMSNLLVWQTVNDVLTNRTKVVGNMLVMDMTDEEIV